ncbi:hypothetical protein IGI04_012396 [Brassica rapa subsp. trilocularis]|uniref:Replication factor A C-terminal domain-containing protein n=1 Tax=Brassica rapa subsp. trilocularis TaxID=1813537 RepID=A0ABQ7N5T3_BRACM|nr:hypothetical protein IGI04_012396 [Brassica rapa subsp. trilocularis]
MATKPNDKSIVSTGKSPVAMYFNDISPGPHESELRFWLIHFWEARNIAKAKTLIGLENLMIDEQVPLPSAHCHPHGFSWTMMSNQQLITSTAFFECIATIDDVVRDSAWYYIACSGCHTKAIKGPTSLMCPKCGNDNVAGVPQYRAKISVYDNNEQAVFVLLGEAGRELSGKHAAEVVDSYFEIPVAEALINTIGQTHKFSVKVSDHNLTGKTQTITVTKILSPAVLPAGTASVENYVALTSEAAGDHASEGIKVPVTVKNQRKQSVQNKTIRASTTHLRGLKPSLQFQFPFFF